MATSTARTTKRLQALVDHGVSPETFEFNHTWYRNSPQGAAHATRTCTKQSARPGAGVEIVTTPLKVTRPCEDCFADAFSRSLNDKIDIGTRLLADLHRLHIDDKHTRREAAFKLEKARELQQRLNRRNDDEVLSPLAARVNAQLITFREQLGHMVQGVAGELARICALDILSARNGKRIGGLSREHAAVLGYVDEIHLGTALYQEWATTFIRTGDTDESRRAALKLAALTSVSAISQMAFKTASEPLPGESHDIYCQRIWSVERDKITIALADVWSSRVSSVLVTDRHGLIAWADVDDLDELPAALVSTFTLARKGKSVVMYVPAVVHDWLLNQIRFATGTISAIAPDEFEQLLGHRLGDQATLQATLEAAISLWEPHEEGIYRSFEAALKAGSLL